MNSFFKILFLLTIIVAWSSCRKDLDFEASKGNLEFSKDTVYLDTVFSNIGSATYSFKVYNRTKDDIEIPTIALAQGQNSSYRLNVDGAAGKEFKNIPIFARDSIFVYVESTFDSSDLNSLDFLNTEVVQFDSGDRQQNVHLVTLVRDAIFLFPSTLADGSKQRLNIGLDENGNEISIEGFTLNDDQLNFTNEKPYVIYGYAAVPDGKQLRIDAGARVHFHNDSGVYIAPGGTLDINGNLSNDQELLENEVVFEGDRFGSAFDDIPGQWGTIWISAGSMNNSIDYLTIKNATVGLFVEGNDVLDSETLTIANTQIHNSSITNLWGKNAFVKGNNLVLGHAGNNALHLNLGGKYDFTHTTIANFWGNGFRQGTALKVDNIEGTKSADLTSALFSNCIIDGNTINELEFGRNEAKLFNFSFLNCMIKIDSESGSFENDPLYDFENQTLYTDVLLNEDPGFFDTKRNDFRVLETSAGRDKANFEGANLVPLDILGIDRTGSPDIGAYEVQPEN